MTYLQSPYFIQKMIIIISIFILIITVFDLFFCIKRKAKPYYCTIIGIIIFIILSFVLICLFPFAKSNNIEKIPNISRWMINIPIWVYILIELLFLSSSIIVFIIGYKFDKKYISNKSIKESFDTLPRGICFYDKNGVLLLTNIMIDDLCLKITGYHLLNGVDFWNILISNEPISNCVRLKCGEKPMIKTSDYNVYSFKRIIHKINDDIFYEINATNITTKYNLSIDLQNKNRELEIFNKRMREHGENINKIIIAEEILNTKIHIHDELGKLLLFTRRALSQDIKEQERNELLALWKDDLIGFSKAKERNKSDTYKSLYTAAKSIDVTINIIGIKPKEKRLKNIIINASIECITNTVKHAKGDIVNVEICAQKNYFIITITNNGIPPKVEIKEGVGLSSLRTLIEREGGNMTIISLPTFMLKIIVPKEK